jgi:hypothetical protein
MESIFITEIDSVSTMEMLVIPTITRPIVRVLFWPNLLEIYVIRNVDIPMESLRNDKIVPTVLSG